MATHGGPAFDYVRKGDLESLRKLVEVGDFDVNSVITYNDGLSEDTILCLAAAMGHLDIIEFLIERGADVDASNLCPDKGSTPICDAVRACFRADVVRVLLKRGADVFATDHNDLNALQYAMSGWIMGASRSGHSKLTERDQYLDIVNMLLDQGIDVNWQGKGTGTPVYCPSNFCKDDKEMVELLLERGARIDKSGNIIGCSTRLLSASTAQVLVAHGAEIDRYAVVYAAFYGNADLLEFLLDTAPPEVVAAVPKLLFNAFATGSGSLPVAMLLLSRGFDVNAADSEGKTALHRACQSGDPDTYEIVNLLLANGACLESSGDSQSPRDPRTQHNSTLHAAAERGHPEVLRLLILAGADLEAHNSAGETPLFIAIKQLLRPGYNGFGLRGRGDGPNPRYDCVRELVEAGASMHARDLAGNTPLHVLAAYSVANPLFRMHLGPGRDAAAALLVQAGAKLRATNAAGLTPSQLASQNDCRTDRLASILESPPAQRL